MLSVHFFSDGEFFGLRYRVSQPWWGLGSSITVRVVLLNHCVTVMLLNHCEDCAPQPLWGLCSSTIVRIVLLNHCDYHSRKFQENSRCTFQTIILSVWIACVLYLNVKYLVPETYVPGMYFSMARYGPPTRSTWSEQNLGTILPHHP